MCVGAFASLALPLLQFALNQLKYSWNMHKVRDTRGFPGERRAALERSAPRAPSGRAVVRAERSLAHLMGLYEQAKGVSCAESRSGRLGATRCTVAVLQARREAGVARILGTDTAAIWADLLARRYDRFVNAYAYYLRCRPDRCAVLTHGSPHCACGLCQLP